MKIAEAIETLTDLKTTLPQSNPEKRREAVELGIEALKREKANRDNPDFVMVGTLPGEDPN